MAQENTAAPGEDPQTPAEDETPSSPPLNRAQRRAQARGKGSASSGVPGHGTPNPSGGGRTGGPAGPVRFPRTGHK